MNVNDVIKELDLQPHPEGGYFKEIYRSDEVIFQTSLPYRYLSDRTLATSIYYLLKSGEFSSFHRIESDEIWHFYYGSPILIHLILADGNYEKIIMGTNILEDQLMQFVIPQKTWFAAEPIEPNSFSLVGCGVSPGFEFEDFELGNRANLIKSFPQHYELITRLTRN